MDRLTVTISTCSSGADPQVAVTYGCIMCATTTTTTKTTVDWRLPWKLLVLLLRRPRARYQQADLLQKTALTACACMPRYDAAEVAGGWEVDATFVEIGQLDL